MDAVEKKKKKEKLFINLVCIVAPLLVMGLWMILTPAKPVHQEVEKGSVYFMKEIWGIPAGITITAFALVLLALMLVKRNKIPKARPAAMSYHVWLDRKSVV